MINRRVVITGLGAVTPIGIGVDAYWESLLAGTSGIGPVTGFDTTGFRSTLAAEFDLLHDEEFPWAELLGYEGYRPDLKGDVWGRIFAVRRNLTRMCRASA